SELLENAIKDRISKGKKPKAIILVYLYGMPAKISEIMQIAEKYEIPVIEDAAEALGSTYKGKKLGTFGTFGILSFNGNKIITTSGGGALISDNSGYIKKSRFLATQARDEAPHYQHSQIGYNYRMSNIVAGIGRAQLEVIEERVKARRKNHEFYQNIFKNIEGIELLEESGKDFYSNFWLTTILIDDKKTNGITNETLRLAFEKENIESRPLWKPMHLQPVFEKYPKYLNGISEKLFKTGLCLPSGSNLSEADKERIKSVIIEVFKN
ncbi:MAG: DegT/DnrJ/EryC1/StrS family aminotransferase, partial [Bacteroidales bacterium]|nr:DegT/DnrJ/EryC1/StrS family aminotransferase [Bacteroidales bacterium]